MSTTPGPRSKRPASLHPAVAPVRRWKLEDAKARLSEVVRMASSNGPQMVTVRGKEAAMILSPEDYKRLLPKPKGHLPLVRFLQGLGLDKLELTREIDTGRELEL